MNREQEVLARAYRYLGLRDTAPDEALRQAAADSLAVLGTFPVRQVSAVFTVTRSMPPVSPETAAVSRMQPARSTSPMEATAAPTGMAPLVWLDTYALRDEAAARKLARCTQVAVSVITLGAEVDRLLAGWTAQSIYRAAVLDACASAWLELAAEEQSCGTGVANTGDERLRGLRPGVRLDPGSNGVSLNLQRELLVLLNAPKRIGVTLTQAGMLVPVKSLTMAVGYGALSSEEAPRTGCAGCHAVRCPYRAGRRVSDGKATEKTETSCGR